jgi:hypothetical protein
VLRHPGTLAAVVALVALAPSPIGTLRSVAGDYHLATPKEPVLARLGYAGPGVIDSTMVHDLDAVLRTYAGAHGAVFDFNDELGLLYYLLNRVPGTRYYHVSMADTGFAQRQLISDVTRSRPRVVVFYGQGIGLPSWDGIEATVRHYDVSDYLLDHYVPLVDVDGQFVMIRSDLAASAPPLPPLTGHASTQDFFLANPECAWGYVPDFLAHPASLRSRAAVSVNSHVVSDSTVFFGGWTSNRRPGQSPLSVLAVRNGHVEATAVPNLYHSNTSPGSGFTVALPVIAGAGPVSFYEMNPDSTVSPLVPRATVSTMLVARADDRVVTTSDGRSHQVITQRGGVVDLAFVGQQRFLAVDLAPGTDLSAYHWLELSTPKGLAGGRYSVMDGRDQSPNLISFQTLPRVAAHVFVQVGSCPQWRGFAPTGLSLIQGGGLKTAPTVRLVR